MTDTKPLAVVTGASSGIGFELARVFADNGFDLIVNAEDDAIHNAAAQLSAAGVEVQPVQEDLTDHDGVERLYSVIASSGRPVAAAALNAGIGSGGPFVENDLADELKVIDLNVKSTVHLAKRVLRDMVARNEGRMLITSSIASTMPGSFHAVYNGSKSFLQSFAEALQNELKDSEVTVTSLMPGATETEFFERADMLDTPVGQSSKDDPADVAKEGFDALMKGKDKVVSASLKTKVQGVANAVLPDSAKAATHRLMAKPEGQD